MHRRSRRDGAGVAKDNHQQEADRRGSARNSWRPFLPWKFERLNRASIGSDRLNGPTWKHARASGLVQSECFSTRRHGWTARGGAVWTTHDGGRGWTRARLRTGSQEAPSLGCDERDAWVVFAEGAAAGTEGYHVYRSLDGGPWGAVLASPFQRKLPSISNYAGPFAPLGHGGAYFTGSCAPCGGRGTATLMRVSSGGAAFARRTVFGGAVPQAVSFVDARHGWVVAGRRLRVVVPRVEFRRVISASNSNLTKSQAATKFPTSMKMARLTRIG